MSLVKFTFLCILQISIGIHIAASASGKPQPSIDSVIKKEDKKKEYLEKTLEKPESINANGKQINDKIPSINSIHEDKKCCNCIDFFNTFSKIAEMALPAVVNVATTQVLDQKDKTPSDMPRVPPGSALEEFFREFLEQMDRPRKVTSLGSGFIIRLENNYAYIVTNHHVIAEAKKISIFLHDKTELEATLHAADERTDIAVLKVNLESLAENKRKLSVLEWGNSDISKVAEWVMAIGNPFGLGSTVTTGIISSKSRDLVAQSRGRINEYIDDFIQHSAQINMGNSGGCLLDMHGKVVGINTAIFSPSGGNVGIGFAIPSNIAKTTVDQLIKFGRTIRGWLGIRMQHMTEDMAESLGLKIKGGAIVGSVTPEGPAEKAGIQSGDVILEFDGKQINETNRLSRLVGETPVGKVVKVKIWRKTGQELVVEAKIGEFEEAVQKGKLEDESKKSPSSKENNVDVLGMQISELPLEIKEKLKEKGETKGIYVQKVDSNSAAAEKGVMRGDIIIQAKQKDLTKPKDLIDSIEEAKKEKRKNIMLLINRNGQQSFISLKIESEETAKSSEQNSEVKKEKEILPTPELPKQEKKEVIPTPELPKQEKKEVMPAPSLANPDITKGNKDDKENKDERGKLIVPDIKPRGLPEHPANIPQASPAA